MMCSLLLTSLLDVKQEDDVFLTSDLVVRMMMLPMKKTFDDL